MTDSKTAEEQYQAAHAEVMKRSAGAHSLYHEYLGAEQLYAVMMGAGLGLGGAAVAIHAADTKIAAMRAAWQEAEKAADEADEACDKAWNARRAARTAAAQ